MFWKGIRIENRMRKVILFFYSIEFGDKIHPFAIDEAKCLREYYDEVHLFCLDAACGFGQLEGMQGVIVHSIPKSRRYTAVGALCKVLLRREVREEIKIANKNKDISREYFKQLLRTVLPGYLMAKIADKCIANSSALEDRWAVEAYWMDASGYAAALIKQKYPEIKAVSRAHGKEIDPIRNKYTRYEMKKFMYETLDSICFISEYGKRLFQRTTYDFYHFVNPDKQKVFRLGVQKEAEGDATASTDGILRIATCARVVPVKRLDLLANALCEIDDVEIEWTHFGSGECMDDLKKIIAKFPENVKCILKGNCINSEVHQYYAKGIIDLFINVSFSEGIPVSVMEACAYGIPIMATDVGGTSEIVGPENGVLLPADIGITDLAARIKGFYELDVEKKHFMRKCSTEKWEKMYSQKDNQGRFMEYITQELLI